MGSVLEPLLQMFTPKMYYCLSNWWNLCLVDLRLLQLNQRNLFNDIILANGANLHQPLNAVIDDAIIKSYEKG